ncbi:MAG: VRR-NUC domain-containing protein [Pseudomonadota bacterium]
MPTGKAEKQIQSEVMLDLSDPHSKLARELREDFQAALCPTGDRKQNATQTDNDGIMPHPARVFRNNVGVATYPGGERVRYGLCPGSSDLIGWMPVTITPEMVGKTVAVFLAVEVKGPRGRLSGAQENFLERVKKAGGIGRCVGGETKVDAK